MKDLALIVFFVLFGFMGLVETKLPHWILAAVALLVAVVLICGKPWNKKP